jgi:hypothetical protein
MAFEGNESWEQIEQEIEELEQEYEQSYAPPEYGDQGEGHHQHHHQQAPEWGGEFAPYEAPAPPAPEFAPMDLELAPSLSPDFSGILGDLNLGDLNLGAPTDPNAPPAAAPPPADPAAPPPPAATDPSTPAATDPSATPTATDPSATPTATDPSATPAATDPNAAPAAPATPPPSDADTDAKAAGSGARIVVEGDLRVTPAGGGIEVYFTLKNAGDADLAEGSGAQTYIQVVGDDGNTLVDRRVGMGQALAVGATHFGGDKLDVHPVHSTVFVYTNYKDDGTYDDLKSADYNPR